jgi:hypothetical protein
MRSKSPALILSCAALLAAASLPALQACGSRQAPFHTDGETETPSDFTEDIAADDAGETSPEGFECPPGTQVCGTACCEEGTRCIDGACCPEDDICGGSCCVEGETCMGGYCHLICEGAVRCLDEAGEEMCCTGGDICFMSACTAPGADCGGDADCALDEYCEEAIGKCLPIPDSDCEYVPPTGLFNPIVEWTWPPEEGTAVLPNHLDVLAPPAVGDMDGDGVPEVAFVSYRDDCSGGAGYGTGVLTILRGDTGEEVLRLDDAARRLGAAPAPAMGDLDADGLPEVVVMQTNFRLLAYEMDGTLLWESDETTLKQKLAGMATPWGGGIAIADLDADGSPEVFLGAVVFDASGHFLWAGTGGMGVASATWGVSNCSVLSTAADLDDDGDLEIVGGNTAYHHDGTVMWQSTVGDGYPGVADLFDAAGTPGKDGLPEVVLIRSGTVVVLNGQTGDILWGPHPIPGSTDQNHGGSPTIADFDGDTLAEIGTAGGAYMAVFDPDGAEPVLWSSATKDTSSAATGSTVFDFEGDGIAEIVYTDECFVHIYSGPDGTDLFKDSNNTRTANEFPLLVDVDADGNSELVVTANACVWDCTTFPDWSGPAKQGVRTYGDALRNWVRTRKVWNEHTYHVTNIDEDGTVPAPEEPNWSTEGLNNFRQNVQTWGVHNAPNLTPELFGADMRRCGSGQITLGVMVMNRGSRGVEAGVNVAFYEVMEDGSRQLLGSTQTTGPLLPGMSEYVEIVWDIPADELDKDVYTFVVVVDDPEIGEVAFHECIEDDNEAGPIDVECEVVG